MDRSNPKGESKSSEPYAHTKKKGSFGVVELVKTCPCETCATRPSWVARKTYMKDNSSTFHTEVRTMEFLRQQRGFPAPRLHATARDECGRMVVFMDALEEDVEQVAKGFRNNVVDVLRIGAKMLDCIRSLHLQGYTHCDVKPANFMLDRHGRVHVIDFGLSSRFIKSAGHVPNKRHPRKGTIRFASIWVHRRETPSRRDDVMSWLFTLSFLLLGRLPWQGTPKDLTTQERWDVVGSIKECVLKEPKQLFLTCSPLHEILKECLELSFAAEPPYFRWIRTMRSYLSTKPGDDGSDESVEVV